MDSFWVLRFAFKWEELWLFVLDFFMLGSLRGGPALQQDLEGGATQGTQKRVRLESSQAGSGRQRKKEGRKNDGERMW